jgi:D-alanyl-lipoteichoic acid acyltransferase DltB (MBOAT superfamily)
MLFNSFGFAVFFLTVLGVNGLLAEKRTARIAFLVAASYFFYMSWNWKFAGLIAFSTILDYCVGGMIFRQTRPGRRKIYLTVSLVGNLGLLWFFKYYNFFIESAHELLMAIGFGVQPALLEIILPVGISFYTFQTLSYTIDIYRGELEPAESFLDFALFVAFFPQLVAGPIVRARDFLPQLKNFHAPSDNEKLYGVTLILTGLFKKVCIADALAASLVDPVFGNPELFSAPTLLIAVYGYAIQIYCDFSGYSDVAIGSAAILGFRLPENFRRPYLSATISEFWRRWHITLSSWMRDYLYIPLGGNRKGAGRTYVNLLTTMLLCGLWHGAASKFVLWGGYHGLLLAAERCVGVTHPAPRARFKRWLYIAVTFHLVCFGWIIFRAPDTAAAFTYVERIATWADGVSGYSHQFGVALFIGFLFHFTPALWLEKGRIGFTQLSYPLQGFAIASLVFWMSIMGLDSSPFIYFQF